MVGQGTAEAGTARLGELTQPAIQAIAGAFFGLAVDFYDIYLPTVALTPAIGYFFPASLPAQTAATLNFIVFTVALLGRPIGALVFGHLGDVIGRRSTTLIAVAGFASMTFLIALLPGYATWGYAAIALLVLLRFVDGIFMGGEYTSANPLALEATPKALRGLVGGVIQSALPIAYVGIAVTVTLVLAILPAGSLGSPYVQWGWRIPFVIGAVLGALFLLYYLRVEESPLWQREGRAARTRPPLVELFSGRNVRNLAQVFLMMTGLWFTAQVAVSFTPTLLQVVLKLPPRGVTSGLLVANVLLAVGYIVVALLGQAFGRRLVLIVTGVSTAVLGTMFYAWMTANASGGGPLAFTLALYAVALCLVVAPWGIVTTYIMERFSTGIRASGYGAGYSLAVVVPGFLTFYLLGLGRLMPYIYTPLVFLVLGGLLQVAGAWVGPETRDVDLGTHGPTPADG